MERLGGDPNSMVGLTAFRAGKGEGAAFSLPTCLPLPLFPLLVASTTIGLLAPNFDFIGEGEAAFIDRG